MPTALRSVALMRDCQPAPLARNVSMTSLSSRRVTCRLGSTPIGGRPGFVRVPSAFCITRPRTDISARLNWSSVHSGRSSSSQVVGQVGGVDFLLTVVTLSHLDDTKAIFNRCPHKHDQTIVEQSVGLESRFWVIKSVILLCEYGILKDLGNISEI